MIQYIHFLEIFLQISIKLMIVIQIWGAVKFLYIFDRHYIKWLTLLEF